MIDHCAQTQAWYRSIDAAPRWHIGGAAQYGWQSKSAAQILHEPHVDRDCRLALVEIHAQAHAYTALISRLRDCLAEQVVVVCRTDNPHWPMARLLALGLQRQAISAAGICRYDIALSNYKPAPEWLNAKNWAHPERWNQQRW